MVETAGIERGNVYGPCGPKMARRGLGYLGSDVGSAHARRPEAELAT